MLQPPTHQLDPTALHQLQSRYRQPCLLAKLLGKKVIYIESFARVTDGNRTGKLIYKFADLFIYQWEQLAQIYPNGVYGGGIY